MAVEPQDQGLESAQVDLQVSCDVIELVPTRRRAILPSSGSPQARLSQVIGARHDDDGLWARNEMSRRVLGLPNGKPRRSNRAH